MRRARKTQTPSGVPSPGFSQWALMDLATRVTVDQNLWKRAPLRSSSDPAGDGFALSPSLYPR